MLVDDEYMILEGLKHIISWQELGFDIVKTAKRAQEAIRYAKNNPVDLIVTDVTMPEMSGIEMIRHIQSEVGHIKTIILSGYEEFDYVKQGIDLGVKSYLVKPVDKEELVKKVRESKQELDDQKKWIQKKKLYHETMLSRWLNDELNEDEFFNYLSERQLIEEGPYTVILVRHKLEEKLFETILTYHKQSLYFYQEEGDITQMVVIFQGNSQQLTHFVTDSQRKSDGAYLKLTVGQSVPEWETTYTSYDTVKKLLLFEEFYGETRNVVRVNNETSVDSGLQFLSFNKALMIGDMPTIEEELVTIFTQMKDLGYTPDNVKHVAFLIFTDVYRHYPYLEEALYTEALRIIQNSNNIVELEEWLFDVLGRVSQKKSEPQRYSSTITEALTIIKEQYQGDLTLKSVSEELHMNGVYLGQLFKKETERSFAQYLNQVRIKKAQELLLQTEKTINEIGYEVGYNATNYFSKMFRKWNGITPKEFRERYEANYTSLDD